MDFYIIGGSRLPVILNKPEYVIKNTVNITEEDPRTPSQTCKVRISQKLMSEHQQLVEDTLAAIASFPFAISRVRFSPDARISLIALKCYKKTHWNISKMILLTYKLQ